jgi:hypothetical protein
VGTPTSRAPGPRRALWIEERFLLETWRASWRGWWKTFATAAAAVARGARVSFAYFSFADLRPALRLVALLLGLAGGGE